MKQGLSILLFVSLFVPSSVFALELIAPGDGAENVAVREHFEWEKVDGASRYVLDIANFTQSEDNILSDKACSGGTCVFEFFRLSVGRITWRSSYTWKVTAYNAAGNPIEDSSSYTFSTEQRPDAIILPPNQGGGPGSGGGPAIDPSDLNPISSENLGELFASIRNFLFGLSIVLLPLVILYAGFLLLWARGDPEKISRARTILLWAVIAFVVILLAGGLPNVIRDLL